MAASHASIATNQPRVQLCLGAVMAKKQPTDLEKRARGVFRLAVKLWKDGAILKRIREDLGLSKMEFAWRAGISPRKLNSYERSGQLKGNFWLFCGHLEQIVISDPNDWEKYLEDPNDHLRGDKRSKRDKRYGKPDKFWRWAEDAKKDEMSRRTGKDIPRDDVEIWHDEWKKLGKPDGWGREESKPMKK